MIIEVKIIEVKIIKNKLPFINNYRNYSAWFFLPLKHQVTKFHKDSRYCFYVDQFIKNKNMLHLSG